MGLGSVLLLAQVTLYVTSFIFSFFIFIPLAAFSSDFNGHCLLHSSGKWGYDNSTSGSQLNLSVDWGEPGFCQFPLFVGIIALPLSFYYIISISIHLYKGTDQSWLHSFIGLVSSCVLFFLLLVSGIVLTTGFKVWCHLLEEHIGCDAAAFVPFTINNDPSISKTGFYVEFGVAQFGVWLSFISWLALLVCAIIKIYRMHKLESFFTSMNRERQRLIQRVGRQPQEI